MCHPRQTCYAYDTRPTTCPAFARLLARLQHLMNALLPNSPPVNRLCDTPPYLRPHCSMSWNTVITTCNLTLLSLQSYAISIVRDTSAQHVLPTQILSSFPCGWFEFTMCCSTSFLSVMGSSNVLIAFPVYNEDATVSVNQWIHHAQTPLHC